MDHCAVDSQGFLNLLASQTSQTVEVESPEIPRFSTQSCEDPKTVLKRKWTPTEDLVLISAWLNTSKDPIVGNEQRAGAFWKRIHDYFNASSQISGLGPREYSQCKQRWGRINEMVCKFVGCYEAALKEQSSGKNENDVMKAANEIYLNDYQSKFNLEHAWRVLRFDQKWSSTCLAKESGKEKRKETFEADTEEVMSEARPPGVKTSKAAKRKRHGNKADLEKLETIPKHKLLERLLANSGTLYALEVSLKNKLIGEMLG